MRQGFVRLRAPRYGAISSCQQASGTPSAAKSLAQSSQNIYGPAMNLVAMGDTVGGAPHQNRQPFLVLNFIIALQGVFPPRG